MRHSEYKLKLLKKKKYRNILGAYDIAFDVGQQITEARVIRGITQQELARRIGTKQPSIARLENGLSSPSLSFLERIAEALDTKLIAPKFELVESGTTIETATCYSFFDACKSLVNLAENTINSSNAGLAYY